MSAPVATYDFIVVGAGSAGAAAAARLSESGKHTVLLLEAGPPNSSFWTRMPLGVAKVLEQAKLTRSFFTEPDPQLHDRRIYWPRGWVVGGSSTVNGMIWVHGTPREYDRWAEDGCPGWSYADLLPWFRKIENYQGGDDKFRGINGPVTVTDFAVFEVALLLLVFLLLGLFELTRQLDDDLLRRAIDARQRIDDPPQLVERHMCRRIWETAEPLLCLVFRVARAANNVTFQDLPIVR